MNKQVRYLLVDGNNLLYSSYHVAKKIVVDSMDGTFFFLRVLLSILRKKLHQKVVVFFDGGGSNFRKQLDPQYKSNRPRMSDELRQQFSEVKQLLTVFGINYLQLLDNEADDLIASFIKQFDGEGIVFDIFSRDKDLLQLLKNNVNVIKYANKKLILYQEDDFFKEYNFAPQYFINYLSVIGDKADNINGVKGIGPVNAKKLIQEYSDIANIYRHLDLLPSKLSNTLATNNELVLANQKLIKLIDTIYFPNLEVANFEWEVIKKSKEIQDFCCQRNFISILNTIVNN